MLHGRRKSADTSSDRPGRYMNRNATWPAEKCGHQQSIGMVRWLRAFHHSAHLGRVGRAQEKLRLLIKEHLFRQKAAPELKGQHVQLEGDWGVERFPYAEYPCNVPVIPAQHPDTLWETRGDKAKSSQPSVQTPKLNQLLLVNAHTHTHDYAY